MNHTEDKAYQFNIDSLAKELFSNPRFDLSFQPPRDIFNHAWLYCALSIERAKRGDFSLMPLLLEIHNQTTDVSISSMCSTLLAIAGPAYCFPAIVEAVKNSHNFDNIVGYCGALSMRGELSYVPVLLEVYLKNRENRDAIFILDLISDVLGDINHTPDFEEFTDEALEVCKTLSEKYKNNNVILFKGEEYSVPKLAKYILANAGSPNFLPEWRRDFEAATGINCSSWYRDRQLRPLAVAATLEEFLASPAVPQYLEGVRYFWGHRIPG